MPPRSEFDNNHGPPQNGLDTRRADASVFVVSNLVDGQSAWQARQTFSRNRAVAALAVAGALLAAVILSIMLPSVFLGTIAVFTAYQTGTGVRLAASHSVDITFAERLAALVLIATAGVMFFQGGRLYFGGDHIGVALVVFGGIGTWFALSDLRRTRWPAPGAERIAVHIGRMGGSAIATCTAVLVVNVPGGIGPVWLPWLAPTVVGIPLIARASATRLRAHRRVG